LAWGTGLVAERPRQPHIILLVATLDEGPGVRTEAHIWTSHDVEWLEYGGNPAHKEWQPGGRLIQLTRRSRSRPTAAGRS
jgi:ADP-ribosyl-[dinitrogen reductase] hydrolase